MSYFSQHTLSDDQVLSEKILQYLTQFSNIHFRDPSLLVVDRKVYLSGRVSSKKIKRKIINGIKKTFGITELIDELLIFKPQSTHGHESSIFKDLGI